ncbi:MAG TPA: hypothetical protein DCR55_10270 [Lentisphaeria bacterium]|nr:hypothetical protein [Lentisphaeria bacterium]
MAAVTSVQLYWHPREASPQVAATQKSSNSLAYHGPKETDALVVTDALNLVARRVMAAFEGESPTLRFVTARHCGPGQWGMGIHLRKG